MRDFTELELTRAVTVIDAPQRARLTWFRIQWEPVSVVMTKPRVVFGDGTVTPETTLDPQVVRIDYDIRVDLLQTPAGTAPKLHALVTGIREHPDPSIVDTDIQEGYVFEHEGNQFRVSDIFLFPGCIEALAVAIG